MKTNQVASLVLICLSVLNAAAQPATLLRDTFDVSADSNDVNFEYNLGRQTGTAFSTFAENTGGATDPLSRINGNRLLLEANATQGFVAVSPNRNFNDGGNFSIDFDLDAGVNDLGNASGDWACIVFGYSTPGAVFVNGSDGVGILFQNNGGIQVFDGTTGVFGGGALPTGPMHVRIEVASGGFGFGSPATVRMFVDGSPVQIGATTTELVKAAGLNGNYITLAGSAFGGNNWIHAFDNFEVAATLCIRPSVNRLNSYPGQNDQVVNVSIPASLNATGTVSVVVTSSNPGVAEPVGAVAGSLTLNFPPGTTTQPYTINALQKGGATLSLSTLSGGCVEGSTLVTVGATFIRNPSFEENFNPAFPGYSPINQWTAIPGGGTGVNEAGGPFHDNSTIPDRARVAIHQGTGGIKQTISGLQPGREHWLQFRYNKRQGGQMALRTLFGGVEIDNIPSIPSAGANAYHFRQVTFTPSVGSGELEFRTTATGDATALIDAVTIVARGPNQVLVQNPSFEASGVVGFPGSVGPASISGWTATGGYGLNVSGPGPFADNGLNPDQDSVAFIQGVGSLSQVISNLVLGQTYKISYSCNARAGNAPLLQVMMGGDILNQEPVLPVGAGAPYLRRTNNWVATATSGTLTFNQLDPADNTLLLDEVQIEGIALPPCQTTVSVERFELFANQPIGPGTVNVGLPLYLVATSAVDVVIISLNPSVAIPTGALVDRITLHFPQGNTTNLSFGITGVGRGVTTFIVSNTLDCASTSFIVRNRSTYLLNPSFEDNSLGGAGYGSIDDWAGGSGVNALGQPFADNGGIPDRNQIAFIQGGGLLSQTIGGLTPGQGYWLQFGYNTRNCCGDPGASPQHLAVRFGGVTIGTISNITAGSYRPATFLFTPASASGALEFAPLLPNGGDRTLLLDAVNIVARGSNDAVVLNSSFEGTGVVPFPGNVQPSSIGGWAGSGSYGVNLGGTGPFADNGLNPDQDNVAFLQDQNSSLATIAGPLELGAPYRLTYSYNARSGNTPHLIVTANGAVAHDVDVMPVGGIAPYHTDQFDFVATNENVTIAFAQTAAGDQTVLFDNVRVVQTGPGGLRLSISQSDANAVRIAWPRYATGYSLECTETLPAAPGAWMDPGLPVGEEGNEFVAYDFIGATKFYRLKRP